MTQGRALHGTVTPPRRARSSRRLARARRGPDTRAGRYLRPLAHVAPIAAMLIALVLLARFPVRVSRAYSPPALLAGVLSLPGLAAAADAASGDGELAAAPLPLTVTAPGTVVDQHVTALDGTADTLAVLADRQRSGAVAAAAPAAAADRVERMPIFFEYRVQPGDTVTAIAARHHVDPDYVVWNNTDISDRDVLAVGTTLQIPSVAGIIHSVRYGETLSAIAARYDAAARDIVDFAANGLGDDPNRLRADSLILVPGGRKPPPVAAPSLAAPSAATSAGDTWTWPAAGPITSAFGPAHPLGIDIGAPAGAAVLAARAGTVVFAGGNPCCSYGYHVIVDHGDGYETTYAHFLTINVVPGQRVAAGEFLGTVGATGHATGPHLHFEIARNGAIQDPRGPGFLH